MGRTTFYAAALSLLGLLVALPLPQSCLACSCAQPPTPVGGWTRATLLAQSNVVFRGQVVLAGPLRDLAGGPGRHLQGDVPSRREASKALQQETIVVTAGSGAGDCTIPFQVGQEWLVYGFRDSSGVVNTGTCSRTSQIPDGRYANDLAVLGSGTLLHTTEPSRTSVQHSTITANATEDTGTVDVQSTRTDATSAQAQTPEQHLNEWPIVLGLVAAGGVLFVGAILITLRRQRAKRRRS